MAPWQDRSGKFSTLKLVAFVGILAPGTWLAMQAGFGWLGSKPVTEAIHQSGDWAVRLLLVSLLVTPLRYVADWPKLILVRRMVGVAALAYTVLHLALYVVEQRYDLGKVVSEIVLRFYLTIGFVALVGLAVLGATSTDAMIKRLGGITWNRLHMMVYGLTVLALLHFFLQTKIDVTEPVLMIGFFLWLMGFRALRRYSVPINPWSLTGLALAAPVATALLEGLWYATMTGVSAVRILQANLSIEYEFRPSWWVLFAALALVVVNILRTVLRRPEPRRGRGARMASPANIPISGRAA
ncbi:sulfoxide reductase heme-binding subunit YedZ [Phreatobacter aquaticus]|uniref:Protein-methionine-sulfoxide reductase heme-binding subunit MsrQ n=1 Tax=Phreatobacter aquaticus TaxID=2570229 RepID=A0A4D7QDS4_9HYPH|nr:ferric reductase-like transmembrane domain-containing protein [Phreatobacter aquaticus]QCK86150.1 sulfoxide reductase heme-binding subunit YedZ [Phreatobacter aquaticus]